MSTTALRQIERPSCCSTCGRKTRLTFHHLIPRKLHRRGYFKRNYDRQALNAGIYVCRRCHSGIHARYDEMTLGKHFASLEALLADEDLARHFSWVARQRET